MNKKLLKLLDDINKQKEMVMNLTNEGKLEEARTAKDELGKMQAKFDILKDLEDEEEEEKTNRLKNGGGVPAGAADQDVANQEREFANAARSGFQVTNTMSEGSPAEGGYTVPEDIQTRINKYREARASLIGLVTVENVTTNKGSRTFKKRSQQTGFTKVGEGGKIGKKDTPQFERMDYEISKYAGYFPVTNELLSDSDQAITSVLIAWIGDESRATRNNIIRSAIDTKAKMTLSGLDDIKKVLNVTLGSAFKPTSSIVTNDDGLQYLDTLKDADGKYILHPDPAKPMQLRLCAGATIVPVNVIPNVDFPSDAETTGKRKIPFVIGDLKEGIVFYDRNQLSIVSSNLAQAGELNAFEEDLTLFRAIEREDCKARDPEAFVNGEIVIDE